MKDLSVILIAAAFKESFPAIRIAIIALLIILSGLLIVIILLQPAKQEGVGAISGSADTFFSKNKGRTREGMLLRLTIIISIVMFVLVLLYFVTLSIYSPTNPFNQNLENPPAAESVIRALAR
jgi:preprotein translocase subunit SecG